MIEVSAVTDVGLVREHNEDAYDYFVFNENTAYGFVCDGMGGEKGGNIASSTAKNLISSYLKEHHGEAVSEGKVYEVMEKATELANEKIYSMAENDSHLKGMGTTMSLGVITGGVLYISHIGDSRIYLIRDGVLKQLTTDHTVAQMLMDEEKISPGEALCHPQRHQLTKALGVYKKVLPFFVQEELLKGDMVLICSDGLYNFMERQDILKIAEDVKKGASPERFTEKAREGGGGDNITAVLAIIK